jgi:uncharacterized membrane protein YfcA
MPDRNPGEVAACAWVAQHGTVTVPELLLLATAGVVAGAASAMAGGASLLTFPVLLALGLPPLAANVTNTTGLIPTAIGAALASREELEGQRDLMLFLCPPMIAGSLAGGGILLLTPPGWFEAIVPFLIAGSALLLLVQPWIIARAGRRLRDGNRRGAWIAAGCVAVYAGYFGAAAAVLFMALVGLFTTVSIHRLNALKNVLLGASNAFAAALFAMVAPVHWAAACALALGSLAGGAGGVRLVRRVPPRPTAYRRRGARPLHRRLARRYGHMKLSATSRPTERRRLTLRATCLRRGRGCDRAD